MADPEKNLLVDLRANVKELIARHDALSQENQRLKDKISDLESNVDQLGQNNRELEQKYENLKLAKLLIASDDEKKDAKSRIQKMVREIDKCIALLNK